MKTMKLSSKNAQRLLENTLTILINALKNQGDTLESGKQGNWDDNTFTHYTLTVKYLNNGSWTLITDAENRIGEKFKVSKNTGNGDTVHQSQ